MSNNPVEGEQETAVVEEHIHLPGASIWPFTLALSLFVAMIGFLFFPHWGTTASSIQLLLMLIFLVLGAVGVFLSILLWSLQISEARPDHPSPS